MTGTRPSATSSATTPPRPSATGTPPTTARPDRDRARPARQATPGRAKSKDDREAHLRGECALRDHPTLSRYLRQTKPRAHPRPRQDRRRGAPRRQVPAHHQSDPSLSAEDVALGYKQLIEAERSFRDLKGTLLLRPVFHRRDDRIRAHVLVCFLALVLVRVAETRTGETWRTIRAELGQIRQGHFQSADGEFTQTSELTTRQRALHTSLGAPEPPRLGRITPPPRPSRRRHTRTNRTNPANPAAHARLRATRTPTTCGTRVTARVQLIATRSCVMSRVGSPARSAGSWRLTAGATARTTRRGRSRYSARRNVTFASGNASRRIESDGSVSVPHMRVMIQVCPSSNSGCSEWKRPMWRCGSASRNAARTASSVSN